MCFKSLKAVHFSQMEKSRQLTVWRPDMLSLFAIGWVYTLEKNSFFFLLSGFHFLIYDSLWGHDQVENYCSMSNMTVHHF